MNKNMVGILSAAVVLTMLTGCTVYDRTKDQFVQPMVKGARKGTSRTQATRVVDESSSEASMTHAHGTCQTHILGQCGDKVETHFAVLDDIGRVINSGYQTCAEYDTDPQAMK